MKCRGFVIVIIFSVLGEYAYTQDTGYPIVDSILNLVGSTENEQEKCNYFNEISELLSVDKPQKSIFYAEKANQLALDIKYNGGIAKSWVNIGRANERVSNFDIALERYFAALLIYENLEIEDEIINIHYRVAIVFKNTGNYYKSLGYCLNALSAMEDKGDKIGVSNVYNIMGSVYKYLGDNEKALEYYYKCAEMQGEYSEKGVSASTFNNIGIIYVRQKKYSKALEYYRKSLKIRRNDKDDMGIAHSYNNIGSVLLEQGQLDSVLIFLEKSLQIKKENDDIRGQGHTYNTLGKYYFKIGEINKSISYLDSSTTLAKEINNLESEKNNYKLLSNIYQEQGQYDSSLTNYKRFVDLKSNIVGAETATKVAQLEFEYEREKAQKIHELNEQKERLVNIIIYGTLILVMLVIYLIYRDLRNRYKQNKLKHENLEIEKKHLLTKIELKDKELAQNILHLYEKNESLKNVRKTLKSVERKLKDENKPLIRSIINKLSGSINNNIWGEFDLRFVHVYNKFYDQLLIEHPDITSNEKRLAAFLKLNMSSKEISMITKQSVHSITVARTRLRKKMGLANKEVSLVNYLSNF